MMSLRKAANSSPSPGGECRGKGELSMRSRAGSFLSDLVIALSLVSLALPTSLSAQLAAEPSNSAVPFKPAFDLNLPILLLNANGPLHPELKSPATLGLFSPGEPQLAGSNSWTGGITIHGGTSVRFPKQSFSLSLAVPVKLLDLRESTHWILNAAFIDRSLMRHKLAYDLFRSLDTPTARRFAVASRFVELVFNGSYHGVYLLMERIDGPLLGLRRYGTNDVNHATIYKAVNHGANFRQLGHNAYELKDPDPLVDPYWQPLDAFTAFVSGAPEPQFLDPEIGIATRVDLGNAIDFHLLVLLADNLDGIDKNFIFARDAALLDKPKPPFFFVPWDYDGTFGRNWDATKVSPTGWLSNNLFDRLMRDPAYNERFARRWKELRNGAFSVKTVQAMIDANVRTLGVAALRNANRWQTAAAAYPDTLTLQEDAAEMKTWIEARIRWLDSEIQRRTQSQNALR